jgi:hypothetical protein
MPKGHPHLIIYQGQPMSLREFADACGIAPKTMQNRWNNGERDLEKLSRPPDKRFSHTAKPKDNHACLSSLLAGWKSVPIASATATGPSARSEQSMDTGSNYGI